MTGDKVHASATCAFCGEPFSFADKRLRKYCSDSCRKNGKRSVQLKRKEDPEYKKELNRKAKLGMREKRKDPEFRKAQQAAGARWKKSNRDKNNEHNRESRRKKHPHDTHVKLYRKYLRDLKVKHDAHVKAFKVWADGQSVDWWAQHLEERGHDPWTNPKFSDAERYRSKYHTNVAFRLSEINRLTHRKEVLRKRDDGTINFHVEARRRKTCVYCGDKLTDDLMCLDHIDPLAKGGENSANNVVVVCKSCNASKGAKDFIDWVNDLPEGRRKASMRMYKQKKGHLPGQYSMVFEYAP